jgi:hypothetical protein
MEWNDVQHPGNGYQGPEPLSCSINCVVRNIYATGAAFDVSSPIPQMVTLNFVTSHERLHCNVVWRQQRRVGVTFN